MHSTRLSANRASFLYNKETKFLFEYVQRNATIKLEQITGGKILGRIEQNLKKMSWLMANLETK